MLCVILYCLSLLYLFFFFNDTPTTEIYTLSLHDALPISNGLPKGIIQVDVAIAASRPSRLYASVATNERSEERRVGKGWRPRACLASSKDRRRRPALHSSDGRS